MGVEVGVLDCCDREHFKRKGSAIVPVRSTVGEAAASKITGNMPQNLSASVSGATRGWLRSSIALACASSKSLSRLLVTSEHGPCEGL